MLANPESQPLFLTRLPAELRTHIWRFVGLRTPYSAFILVADEVSRLARHLHCPTSREICLNQGSHLSAKMVSVFGTEYIQDLILDRDYERTHKILKDITWVRYITSLGGICAIQLYGSHWESSWIGKIPSTDCIWHGIVRGTSSCFRFSYNVSWYHVFNNIPD